MVNCMLAGIPVQFDNRFPQLAGLCRGYETDLPPAIRISVSADELEGQEELVRRMVGQGHQIGLALTGPDPANCLEQWERARDRLAQIACCTTVIASADGLDGEGRRVLEEAGCALWTATLKADGLSSSVLLRRLSSTYANYVEFPCDTEGLALLNGVLRTLTGDGYRLRQALATAL